MTLRMKLLRFAVRYVFPKQVTRWLLRTRRLHWSSVLSREEARQGADVHLLGGPASGVYAPPTLKQRPGASARDLQLMTPNPRLQLMSFWLGPSAVRSGVRFNGKGAAPCG